MSADAYILTFRSPTADNQTTPINQSELPYPASFHCVKDDLQDVQNCTLSITITPQQAIDGGASVTVLSTDTTVSGEDDFVTINYSSGSYVGDQQVLLTPLSCERPDNDEDCDPDIQALPTIAWNIETVAGCLPGYTTANGNCTFCPKGTASADPATACAACAAGTKAEVIASETCSKCPESQISFAGASSCYGCRDEQVPNEDQNECVDPPFNLGAFFAQPEILIFIVALVSVVGLGAAFVYIRLKQNPPRRSSSKPKPQKVEDPSS